jgi:antibiotic biosynthesis monooxygenase
MYVIMGVHHPKPGMEKELLETLERFGDAERGHRGLITAFVWRDDTTGVLLGTTLWDTKEDYDAARPDMDKALGGADWRSLDASMEIYRGSPVAWS